MTALQDLEQGFQSYLFEEDSDKADQHPFSQAIMSTEVLSSTARLKVYYTAYRLRLIEFLETDYPGVKGLLGDEAFDAVARDYIARYPSASFSARFFGQHFRKFFETTPSIAQADCLAEMAAFEWMMIESFDAPDDPPLQLTDLQNLPQNEWQNLQLTFHEATFLLPLHWNIPDLWRAIADETEQPEPLRQDHETVWLIWRTELNTCYHVLTEPEVRFLQGFNQGLSFGEVCACLCDLMDPEDVTQFAAAQLQMWINEAIFDARYQLSLSPSLRGA